MDSPFPEAAPTPLVAPAAAPPGASTTLVSDRLVAPLELAIDHDPHRSPTCSPRCDGWTPDRARGFLNALADCGVVADAARAVGMSRQSAYNLRNRTANRAFHLAWAAAELRARQRLCDELMSRAIHGCKEVIIRDGLIREERHRFDNRLSSRMLNRLDRKVEADDSESRAVNIVSREFDLFLDILCGRRKEVTAAEFIAVRRNDDDSYATDRDCKLLERAQNYRLYGGGLPHEVPMDDLFETLPADWTEEQWERARACRWVDEREYAARPGAGDSNPADGTSDAE